ncbi:UDP-N-acetylglucosamine 2-epimerase [Comamonas terrigena]|uniref:UDP-N-acetylglucosamine 2-epimerase n=1 Tax=Comamonas terrigena TaxID=32013 RepID=UPI00244BEDDC|nr:UDP-N-acetylglucosamine 2-epimerase [Comamonas terrigena]MDH1500101.1 UDP-N-acetylglucosamine 2-epimerase [Comamonas terrigena]
MTRILGMTSIRSDYDLMSGVYRRLARDPEVDFKLLVSGAHLSPAFGRSVELIRQDGLEILAEIETLISGDSKSSRLKTAAGLLTGALEVVRAYRPDILVYAGDREDVLIGATLGAFLDIPTVHFFGGDHAADGHVDNPVRHATSKLSTAHFVSIEEHAQRLAHLGEDPRRVHVIGSVALDKFVAEPSLDRTTTLSGVGAKPHALGGVPLAILIFHPVDQERELAPDYVRGAVGTLIERGYHVLIGAPNADPGNAVLLAAMQDLAQAPEVTFYGNTARAFFVNLMRHAALMVGNSSAGLLEAASVGLPVINLGERQRGRLCGGNVVFSDGDKQSFRVALDRVASEEFNLGMRMLVNPYGDGHSEARAVELLKQIDFGPLFKKTEDPLNVHP